MKLCMSAPVPANDQGVSRRPRGGRRGDHLSGEPRRVTPAGAQAGRVHAPGGRWFRALSLSGVERKCSSSHASQGCSGVVECSLPPRNASSFYRVLLRELPRCCAPLPPSVSAILSVPNQPHPIALFAFLLARVSPRLSVLRVAQHNHTGYTKIVCLAAVKTWPRRFSWPAEAKSAPVTASDNEHLSP
ncbi:hypothetical protein HPB51_029392 [Rhipicephalus microplus]|uniref:Uncharacterized protein n=1 Tax=Rhipicephalus microplus TaxID=6941 RepID=A0A9J6CUJ9_RHIMP|nr:hypothetical protein HPB51_029392 [Rhipicephalus microplus]